MKFSALLPHLFLACVAFMPQLARGQTCEWDGFPEPSSGANVIEVIRHGGYGQSAGRTLVSVDASGQIALLARGECPDRTLVGRLAKPTFDDLVDEFRRAVASVRSQPPRPFVSDDHPLNEILREGRMEPLCQSFEDGVDVDVTLYRYGAKEHYTCVSGALLRFSEDVLRLVSGAICTNRITPACIEFAAP